MNLLASSYLSKSALAILPPVCQAAIKKLVCANIYFKCKSINSNFFDATSPLLPAMPFERPCKKVCDDVNINCLGILPLLGLPVNDCSEKYNYNMNQLPDSLVPYRSSYLSF